MKAFKNCLNLYCVIFIIISFNFGCTKKAERRLIGEWEIINSSLYIKSNYTLIHKADKLGEMSLSRKKANLPSEYANEGSWNFTNFPDSIIPVIGSLLWTSTDKDNYVKIPWNIHLIFSTEFKNDIPKLIGGYFDCYQGYLNVTELKKNMHYKIEGDIFKDQTDPNKPENANYRWVFELQKK